MTELTSTTFTAFASDTRLAAGPLTEIVRAIVAAGRPDQVLVFGDSTGRVVDIDTRGDLDTMLARLPVQPVQDAEPRGRGRPKLGVTAREVTLMPRHWDWLAAQPGGASVALRKLVETASKANESRDRTRAARDAAYRFMTTMAGDRPNFEEAIRALFAGDRARMASLVMSWPKDVRDYALSLSDGETPSA